MIDLNNLPSELVTLLQDKFGESFTSLKIPPTAFSTMKGELLDYSLNEKTVVTKFPVLSKFLNQFGNMQGGMVAAAIDNTLGPLSMLVAPPNFTRNLEVKYKKIIKPRTGYIFVEAKLVKEEERQLYFTARVKDSENNIYAVAKATHWVL